jgi:benzoate 4-monooxygenase
MVEKGRDECEAQLEPGGPIAYAPGAETLNRRGEVSTTLGLLPTIRPYAKYLPDPFFSKGMNSIRNLHGMAVAAVDKRLVSEKCDKEKGQRHDILDMLIRAKDSSGYPMARDELISEALTELIAGSDTVSNTACAIFYWILHGERAGPGTVVPRLQAELDEAVPSDAEVATFEQVRNLPFLRRCIDEGMRLHSTSALGLPRIVTSPTGVQYNENLFPAGTVLSVPSYSIHHDAEVWGDDVEDFRPDRWLPENLTERQKNCFNPFSYGPRACVGQNVARMELALIIGTAFSRYDFELYQERLVSHEGFSKKPDENWIGIRRRGRKVAASR